MKHPRTAAARKQALIDRINEISQLARTAWFSLIAYLLFVGITLLGVEDADFFVSTRQTQLPLVNVQIPTQSFFYAAPILGAALYTYLHLFLIKLWEAHGQARTRDADPTHHWLVNDYALIHQGDPTARARPLSWMVGWITLLLVWLAGPIVLGYAWWRSMPAHNEWMTLLIAACFFTTLCVGFTSWTTARARLRNNRAHRTGPRHKSAAAACALVLIAISWLRTEGGLDAYIDGAPTLDDVSVTIRADRPSRSGTPVFRWWLHDHLRLPLARTDLAGVDLVPLPSDWRTPETARSAFREVWCKREGLTMDVCGQPRAVGDAPPWNLAARRVYWCSENGSVDANACDEYFARLDSRFQTNWLEERSSSRSTLPSLDLRGRDLRGAFAPGVSLVGADLTGARLEGAFLASANLEGAVLSDARLQQANFDGARLEEARLTGAAAEGASLIQSRLERADLSGADLHDAQLGEARLEAAILKKATLDGATFVDASLDGANMEGASFEGAYLGGASMLGGHLKEARLQEADLHEVRLDGASLQAADLRGAKNLSQGQLDGAFGTDLTLLPVPTEQSSSRLHVWTCWDTPPPGFEALVDYAADVMVDTEFENYLRDDFLCDLGKPRRAIGTPLALDEPYPKGHPLAEQG